MFSGIVEEMAQVVAIERYQENIDFVLKCSFTSELKIDQSIAHNGVCLTVVRLQGETYTVTAMKETLDRSNLALLKVALMYQVKTFTETQRSILLFILLIRSVTSLPTV